VSFWDHRYTAFLFGFFGGLVVNLFRLYLISQSPEAERPDFDWVYWTQFAGLANIQSEKEKPTDRIAEAF
jgi:hypothetical protein